MPVPSVSGGSLQLGTPNVGNLSHCLEPAKIVYYRDTIHKKKGTGSLIIRDVYEMASECV
jgi:hypothetical protein